eukprot:CAMPEP_0204897414 /NCGR_PEP_ID=MMETSP1397-20131031/729_1 /ASSEMBLY_ACC=CAM_ASM_000891 /TAXON_ID=49980 /ORGANISM="Climacostomum Climacostomum virens, Strain Stock W-24" /LENGTH=258 /DNA_ID=CAMNT_0052065165 /DNA_START=28 /DNA_END=800 /DNA_ORIENTATION=-
MESSALHLSHQNITSILNLAKQKSATWIADLLKIDAAIVQSVIDGTYLSTATQSQLDESSKCTDPSMASFKDESSQASAMIGGLSLEEHTPQILRQLNDELSSHRCRLTNSLLRNPVLGKDSFFYEKAAFLKQAGSGIGFPVVVDELKQAQVRSAYADALSRLESHLNSSGDKSSEREAIELLVECLIALPYESELYLHFLSLIKEDALFYAYAQIMTTRPSVLFKIIRYMPPSERFSPLAFKLLYFIEDRDLEEHKG